MKSLITTMVLSLGVGLSAMASTQQDTQKMTDAFYQGHEVSQSYFYCRTDIKAPECRTLMIFRNKQTGKVVPSFQMAFSAPFRQAAGTELFIANDSVKNTFYRIVDSTVDGKMNGTLESVNQVVLVSSYKIQIKNIKFGTLIADLKFDGHSSVLKGTNNGQPVQIIYPRVQSE